MKPAERKVLTAALFLSVKSSPITSRSLQHHARLAHSPALDAIMSLCASGHLSQIISEGPRRYRPERDLLGALIDRGAIAKGEITVYPPAYAVGYGFGAPDFMRSHQSNGQD